MNKNAKTITLSSKFDFREPGQLSPWEPKKNRLVAPDEAFRKMAQLGYALRPINEKG